MGKNTAIYTPSRKDHAFVPQPEYPQAEQWWYYDAVLENGYSMIMAWRCTDLNAQVILEIADAAGKMIGERMLFPRNKVMASTETLDISMGDNRTYGEYPLYHTKFLTNGLGVDLVFECVTQEFRQPPDGCYVGRAVSPATPLYFAGIFSHRCRVSGNLVIDGKKIPVAGEGYTDHQWGNVPFRLELIYYYYWGKAFLQDHTVVWWEAQLCEKTGYQKYKWLWVFKGNDLIQYSNNAEMYIEPHDFEEIDQSSGVAFPQKVTVMLNEEKINGTLDYQIRHNLILVPRRHGQIVSFRHLADCHAQLEIAGEEIASDCLVINELCLR